MVYLNKKLVHEYVTEWFNFHDNWNNTNDWENDVFNYIAQYYFDNEFPMDDSWNNKHVDKLYSLIKNDQLYVKNYKHWFVQNALNKIKKDF